MSSTIVVSNAAELALALSTARGGETILLEGGTYGDLTIIDGKGIEADFPSTVTIRSMDPADPAVFSKLDLRGASNLAIENVTFDYTFTAGDPSHVSRFDLADCQNIAIRGCTFDGDVASGTSVEADGFGVGYGLSVARCDGVVLENNEVFEFHRGFVIGDSTDVVVRGNDIHSLRSDGMNFAQVQGVLIEGNHIHDFRASFTSGDHRDMIQFWTNGSTEPSTDIVIRNNLLDIGTGNRAQSIFMRNELVDKGLATFEAMAYRNILIENNTIINAHSHGITVGETDGLIVRNNSVLHADGGMVDGADQSVEIPKINIKSTSINVDISKNVTSVVNGYSNQASWTVSQNVLVQDQNPLGANHYSTVFQPGSLVPQDGMHKFLAVVGGVIDQLNAGSSLTQGLGEWLPKPTPVPTPTPTPTPTPSPVLDAILDVSAADRAARIFDAADSTLGDKPLPSGAVVKWSFGDGTTATGTTVEHRFAKGGSFEVTVTITTPDGQTDKATRSVVVDGPELVSLSGNLFVGYEDGASFDLGLAPRMTTEGLQLGVRGVTATVAREHVVDVAGANDMAIGFTLDADKRGTSGELFRLDGSFVANVTRAGELQFSILQDGLPTQTFVTSGARLNAATNVDKDVAVRLVDGRLTVHVDGVLRCDKAFGGQVGGEIGHAAANLLFGNPGGAPNFNGDLSDFDMFVDLGDFATTPASLSAFDLFS